MCQDQSMETVTLQDPNTGLIQNVDIDMVAPIIA